MAGKELQLLKEEERTLVLLHTKLSDQLNRLKVEELALSSMLRLNNRPASSTVSTTSQMTDNTVDSKEPIKKEIQSKMDELETKYQEALDLNVRAAFLDEEEEEEEEEDDEPETVQDQLSAFLDELSARKQ